MGRLSINDSKREVSFPKRKDSELAEFIGILTGDGYMNTYRKYDYVVEIAGNKLYDQDYLNKYLTNLIKKLFNMKPRYIEKRDQNSAYLRIRSKAIFNYLLRKGFKKGKKGRIGVPKWIIQKEELMNYFVKGLFDTDGCISLKNKEGKKYPVISITSKSDLLLLKVKKYINFIGISAYITKYVHKEGRYKNSVITNQLQVNGYNNLNLWFNLIGSSNKRNLDKYNLAMSFKTKV